METNAQYFDCLCRTCMNKVEASSHDDTTKPQRQWLSIFDLIEECGQLRIAELLSEAVPQIIVQPIDELPKKICRECLQQLLRLYRFQQMCVQSDKQMQELFSKEHKILRTPMLEEAIKGETEGNYADSEPLKDLPSSNTPQNLQDPSIQESLAEVRAQTNESEAAQSSADDRLQDDYQLLEQCIDAQGEFEEFIKNEPIEDDEANSEYSDGDTMHSTISVNKDEPINLEDVQINVTRGEFTEVIQNEPIDDDKSNTEYSDGNTMHSTISVTKDEASPIEPADQQVNVTQDKSSLFVINEPIEDDNANTERSDGDTMHSTMPVMKDEPATKSEDEQVNYARGEFREFIKNEPIEDDNPNTEYSDGDTMHATITVTQDEASPIEHENQQVNDASCGHNCHLCNKSYKLRDSLRRHLNDHKRKANNSKEYCYACHLCSESYKEQRYLTKHLHLEHSIKSKGYTCDVCNKSFVSPCFLRRHIRTHTGERPYSCSECGKSYTQKGTLAQHRKTHSGDMAYECSYCQLRFSSRPAFKRHSAIHEETKGHECDICGKNFKIKCDLRKHKKYHYEERPHKCDLCGQQFVFINQLQIHIRSHTGEKPYKCKYCGHGSASNSILNKHLRTHLGRNIYRCDLCPLAFPLDSEMRLHLASHKNEDPETRERNLKALQEEEAKLLLKLSKKRAGRHSKEEQQRFLERKLRFSRKEVEQPSTE